MKRRLLPASLLALLAVGATACGSGSSSARVVLAPSGGPTSPSSTPPTPSTPTTTPTATTPTATTPTSGPLSKQPTIAKATGPAPTTLVKKDLVTGTGKTATASSHVVVNYVGALYSNGTVFDASWKHGMTFPVALGQGQVIPGWDQGIPGMKVGGRRELIIPASLAYGKGGRPPTIPGNATLVFDIDLLSAS